MSKYTTGEVAKLCGVTVRTVQYYDQRSILIPSELTEGGRRLYTEDDVKKLKIICLHTAMYFSNSDFRKMNDVERWSSKCIFKNSRLEFIKIVHLIYIFVRNKIRYC